MILVMYSTVNLLQNALTKYRYSVAIWHYGCRLSQSVNKQRVGMGKSPGNPLTTKTAFLDRQIIHSQVVSIYFPVLYVLLDMSLYT